MSADPAVALFGTEDFDLYEVLNIGSTASNDDIKRAYRRLALQFHPDKVNPDIDKDEATTRFQQIGFAYAVLSDLKRKEWYDKTGSTESSFWEGKEEGFDWSEYFKSKWTGEVNAKTLDDFKTKYQGSEEEKEDILAAYNEYKGDMLGILNAIACSSVLDGDEERFREIIQLAIDNGEVKVYKKFTSISKSETKSRRKAAETEALEAEEYAKELGVHDKLCGKKTNGKENQDDLTSLAALIRGNREKKMNAFFDNLEAKYGEKTSRRGKRSEPSEEAFAATAARKNKKKK